VETFSYDQLGRRTFQSYPNSEVGVQYAHDALSRLVEVTHPDGARERYEHDGSVRIVTDARDYETVYEHRVIGNDLDGAGLVRVVQPEGVITVISRDILGNIRRVIQGSDDSGSFSYAYAKDYEYDERQFLVEYREGETGITRFEHDAVGNVIGEHRSDGAQTTLHYDGLGRVVHTERSDDSPDTVTVYDGNGNVLSLQQGMTQWGYEYDANDNLIEETLTIDHPLYPIREYRFVHSYNGLDFLDQSTYPSGLEVDYQPDALGRPTRAGSFATQVQWHPSGQLESHVLGNDVTTQIDLDERLRVQRIHSQEVLDLGYSYDAGGNVTAIVDGLDSSNSIHMTGAGAYDGLGRLVSATGPWGSAQYSYDEFGNFRQASVGSVDLFYGMDIRNRLVSVRELRVGNGSVEHRLDHGLQGNVHARQRRMFTEQGFLSQVERTSFRYDASQNLRFVLVEDQTESGTEVRLRREYHYDGHGHRAVEHIHGSYEVNFSVYDAAGRLVLDEQADQCKTAEYIYLGRTLVARSDFQHTDPNLDSDGDGVSDCLEVQLGLDPFDPTDVHRDDDGDGLTNLEEIQLGTSIFLADTDGDGLTDWEEVHLYGTDPLLADTDGDGLTDFDEVHVYGLDPLRSDTDRDGVSDYWELVLGTDPLNPADGILDTDGDGFSNRQKSLTGFDPSDALMSPDRGSLAWSFESFSRVTAPPAIGEHGTVYVASDDALIAIWPDGSERWRLPTEGLSLTGPVIGEGGTVYAALWHHDGGVAGAARTFIYALSPDGEVEWRYETDAFLTTELGLGSDGLLYFGGYHFAEWGAFVDFVRGIDREGALARSQSIDGVADAVPVLLATDELYVVSTSGEVQVFSDQGEERWRYQLRERATALPSVDFDGTYYIGDDAGYVYALSGEGELLWERQFSEQAQRSSIVIDDAGRLYVGTREGELHALNPQTGTSLWSQSLGATVLTPALSSGGSIYAMSAAGTLHAYTTSGDQAWAYAAGGMSTAPAVLDQDGMLYVARLDGQILALVDNTGGLVQSPWPMHRHDAAGSSLYCFSGTELSTDADSDNDGMPDCWEVRYGFNPFDPSDAGEDADGDGLTNLEEYQYGTNPLLADTDGDGLTDWEEIYVYGTDPLSADTDGDGIPDGVEVALGLDPLNPDDALEDADGDGFSNRQEVWAGTDPLDPSNSPVAGQVGLTLDGLGAAVKRPLVAPDGTIFQNSGGGLVALGSDFSSKWTWPSLAVGDPALGPDGTLYFVGEVRGGNYQTLYAIYPNGLLRWQAEIWVSSDLGAITEGPVVDDAGNLYLHMSGTNVSQGRLRSWSADGEPRWSQNLTVSNRPRRLSIDEAGDLVVFAPDRGIERRNSDTGALIWHNPLVPTGDVQYSHVISDGAGRLYAVSGTTLFVVDSNSGNELWSYPDVRGAPVIDASGNVIVRCGTVLPAPLCAIDASGELAWITDEAERFEGVPAILADGSIVTATDQGQQVVAFYGDGGERWRTDLGATGTTPRVVVLQDGALYVPHRHQPTVLLSDGGPLAESAWPTHNRDQYNSRNANSLTVVPPPDGPMMRWLSQSPSDLDQVDVGQAVTLTVRAVDLVDGDLSESVTWHSDLSGYLGSGATLVFTPEGPSEQAITAEVFDTDGNSDRLTVLVRASYLPPSLEISTTHHGSNLYLGEPLTLRGTAVDGADGDISEQIEWMSDRTGYMGTGAELVIDDLPLGTNFVTARITDSHGAMVERWRPFELQLRPPVLTIHQPASTWYSPEGAVPFSATAIDSVDGDLSSEIRWHSDRSGLLGEGSEFELTDLPAGRHIIVAVVRNSSGQQTLFSTSIDLGSATVPRATIYRPDHQGPYEFGEPITFVGDANPRDDVTPQSSILWHSDLDGQIGSGPRFTTSSLSAGHHLIRASVTNAYGDTGGSFTQIRVRAGAQEGDTSVAITPLSPNASFVVGTPVALSASARSAGGEDISDRVQWSSSLAGDIGSGSVIYPVFSQSGMHLIRATVTDDAGNQIHDLLSPAIYVADVGESYLYQLFHDTFGTSLALWREVNETSSAVYWSGQSSSISEYSMAFAGDTSPQAIEKPGTHLTLSSGQYWQDYRFSAALGGGASGAIGLMFRYIDNDNYYRISMDSGNGYRRLVKKVDGDYLLLWEDAVAYDPSAVQQVEVSVVGDQIELVVNEEPLITLTDDSHHRGTIGLYSWRQSGSTFSALRVENLMVAPVNTPPFVAILSPLDGDVVELDESLSLIGLAQDAEDGDLSASLRWYSDRDGLLGEGAEVSLSDLRVGAHVIRAEVIDSAGARERASATIEVLPGADSLLLDEDFGSGTAAGWSFVDEPSTSNGPSAWQVIDGELTESSDIRGGILASWWPSIRGTYARYDGGFDWTDYRIETRLRGSGAGGIGVMFRLQDNNNYYRFEMDAARNFRRLIRRVDGSYTVLWQQSVGYTVGQSYLLEVTVEGEQIRLSLDGEQIYAGADASLDQGTVGLHNYALQSAHFDSVRVVNLGEVQVNTPPELLLQSPEEGAVYVEGQLLTLSATAVDVEDGDLSHQILWDSSIDGALGSGPNLSINHLAVGEHTITASVTDSDGAAVSRGVGIVIEALPNQPPELVITAPTDGATFGHNTLLSLAAQASDPEDGDLSGSVLWSSDRAGSLGMGASISVAGLEVGPHEISATVTDSGGLSVTEAVTISIYESSATDLLIENFTSPDISSWQIVDEPNTSGGPSNWAVVNGELRESSAVYGGIRYSWYLPIRGTYAWYGDGLNWTDYQFSVRLRGTGSAGMGVMFRYQDNDNYYRFEMDSNRGFRRLVKKVDGSYSSLHQDSVSYQVGQDYLIEVEVSGDQLSVSIDGELFYSGTDTSLTHGSVALYNYAQQNAYYGEVRVTAPDSEAPANNPPTLHILSPDSGTTVPAGESVVFAASAIDVEDGDISHGVEWTSDLDGALGLGASLGIGTLSVGQHIIEASITDSGGATTVETLSLEVVPSSAVLLVDNFDSPDISHWQIVDEPSTSGGPSNWAVVNGELRESSAVYGGIRFSWYLPIRGTYAWYGDGLNWTDYQFSVRLRGTGSAGMGVMFRYQDNDNYYRFEMDSNRGFRRLVKKVDGSYSSLHQDSVSYQVGQDYLIEVDVSGDQLSVSIDGELFYSGTDTSLTHGSVALYNYAQQNAYYDNVEVRAINSLACLPAGPALQPAPAPTSPPVRIASALPVEALLQMAGSGLSSRLAPDSLRLLPALVSGAWSTTLAGQASPPPAAPVIGAAVTTYLHTDHLGSVVAASDADGDVLWRRQYTPYGMPLGHEPGDGERKGYTGHPHDRELGLIYMRARYYDPMLGRFLSPDPLRFVEDNPMSFNRYDYANGNPYRYWDPDGREALPINVEGNPELDALAVSTLNSLPQKRPYEEMAVLRRKDESLSASDSIQLGPVGGRVRVDMSGAEAVVHTHPHFSRSDGTHLGIDVRATNRANYFRGPKDDYVVNRFEIPNYFRVPDGSEIKAVERIDGKIVERTVWKSED
jgi:RHS repeat-associated protein